MTQCTRFSKAWARPVGDTARLVRDISMCRSWQPWLRATLLVLACTPTAVAVALALLLSRPGPVEPDAGSTDHQPRTSQPTREHLWGALPRQEQQIRGSCPGQQHPDFQADHDAAP